MWYNEKYKSILYPSFYKRFQKDHKGVDYKTWDGALKEYFSIYFNELYFEPKPKYFFISGYIQKGRTMEKIRIDEKKEVKRRRATIGFLWFLRPHLTYWSNVVVKKISYRTSKMPLIDKQFRKTNDVDKLPYLSREITKLIKTNKLYKDA